MFLEQFNAEERARFLQLVARGEYNLLLGAGASVGANGGDGLPLPTAQELSSELLINFGVVTEGEQIELRTAYEIVEGMKDNRGRTRNKYLAARFSNCRPTWHSLLAKIRWRRIWTLNIDDVVEQAYKEADSPRQKISPYNWDSLFSEPNLETDELQIIHLHGLFNNKNTPEPKLIFSIVEYLRANAASHAWHRVFGDYFLQQPFIAIGARLTDEYDLAEFLRRGNQSKQFYGVHSLVVLRKISAINRKQFIRWGLLPIESDADQFFEALSREIEVVEPRIAALTPKPSNNLTREARIFLHQFQWLRPDTEVIASTKRDFYQGDEPSWADIVANRDAPFNIVSRMLTDIKKSLNEIEAEKRQEVFCIWGSAGSGKTTALLRVARELISNGFDVFYFRAEERLDIQAVKWWLSNSPRCALLFDGLADLALAVGILAKDCTKQQIPLLVCAAERNTRLRQIFEGIAAEHLRASDRYKMEMISDDEIRRLLNKLREERRLGKLTRANDRVALNHFKKGAGRQLLVGMYELERGRGFFEKISEEFKATIKDEKLRRVYALSCITFNFGYPLPIGICSVAAGLTSGEIIDNVSRDGELAGIVQLETRGLRPRHRVIASMLLSRVLHKGELYELSQSLATVLAPYVNSETSRQRTLQFLIVRSLMDEEVILDWCGRSQRARDWYTNLKDLYDWTPRYWEQRALVESELKFFPTARSFAEEALRLRKDTFTLTTLGTILLRMSVDFFQPGTQDSYDFLMEGISHLKEARRFGQGKFEHPYKAFFSYALRYAKALPSDQGRDARLLAEWQKFMREATAAPIFQHYQNMEELREFQRKWLMLAATEGF